MYFFTTIAWILSVFALVSFLGVAMLIAHVGTVGKPHKNIRFDTTCQLKNDDGEWERDPDNNPAFLYQSVAGIIVLSMVLTPMVMRPLDFVKNFNNYMWGLVAYMLLMPFFNTVLQVYAYTNLHDVSWGNRPAQGGGAQASEAAKKAAVLKQRYM